MQFRLMRNFIVVAQELHMHRAAERLGMAQPALSQQIKNLEAQLGVALFSRAHRRLTLTPAGEAFQQKAQMALEMADRAVLEARRTARGEQGVLNLGYVSSAMFNETLPGMLRQLHTRWPEINVSLVTGDVQTLYEAVAHYHLDIAAIRGPLATLPEELRMQTLAQEKTTLALYAQHPLAGSAALTLASLKNESWISLTDPDGVGLEQYFIDACRSAGFQPRVVQKVSDVPTLISLVSAGFGIALLPASAQAIRLNNVVYVDILDRLARSELALVYHRAIRSEVVKKFLAMLHPA